MIVYSINKKDPPPVVLQPVAPTSAYPPISSQGELDSFLKESPYRVGSLVTWKDKPAQALSDISCVYKIDTAFLPENKQYGSCHPFHIIQIGTSSPLIPLWNRTSSLVNMRHISADEYATIVGANRVLVQNNLKDFFPKRVKFKYSAG